MAPGELRVPADPAVLGRLREVLLAEGYTDAGLGTALGGTAGFGLPAFDAVAVARRLPPGPLHDLVTLFMIGGSVRRKRLERLFAKKGCGALEQAGILVADGGGDAVRAGVAIHTWGDLLLASDRLDGAEEAEHVVGMTPAAATLSHLTIRTAGATALDLGTGCGVEALLAARHSPAVIATDANPRAVELTAINARLNGVRGIELAVGNWFEPVAGRRFDLVVSNPPFVISPDSALLYRDGDDPGDGVSRHVVCEAAAHLETGGHATVLCNWIRRRDEEPEPPLAWVAQTGCDAIVLRYGLDDPVAYAASWNHALRAADPAGFEAALDRWLDHYRELGVRAIASGAVVLHRRDDPPPRATALEALEAPTGPADAQLRRIFAAQELVAGGDEALLAAQLRPAGGQAIEQTLTWSDGAYRAASGLAVLEPGAGLAVEVDDGVAEALAGGRLEREHLPTLRRMLEHGLLDIG